MDVSLLIALIGIVCGVVGYFVRRWLEDRPFRERLQEASGLADLHLKLNESGATLESLNELRAQLKQRRRYQEQNESDFLDALGIEARSQTEMNQQAYHLMDIAQRQLDYLVGVLEGFLREEEFGAFQKAHSAWKAFARRQAEFASEQFHGGFDAAHDLCS